MKRPEAEKLADLVLDELRRPGEAKDFYGRVAGLAGAGKALSDFLDAKDRQHRGAFYLQSEEQWFRLFGWTLAKALMLLGLLVAAGFLLAGGRVTADQAATIIFGASAYYVVVYLLTLRRYAKNPRKIEKINSDYRSELRTILEDLVRDHGLDAAKYRAEG